MLHALNWVLLAAGVWPFAKIIIPIVTGDQDTGLSDDDVYACIRGVTFAGLAALLFKFRQHEWLWGRDSNYPSRRSRNQT